MLDGFCNLQLFYGDYNFINSETTNDRGTGDLHPAAEITLINAGEFSEGRIKLKNCIPDEVYKNLPSVPYDVFNDHAFVKYNYYSDGGVLLQLKNGEYFYSNIDKEGNHYYLRWIGNEKVWVPYDLAKPHCTSCDLKLLFSIWGIMGLIKEAGHTSLDIAGSVPIAGEAFDVVNGVWYAIEGDATNAVLSLSSAVPVVGWIGTAGKLARIESGSNFRSNYPDAELPTYWWMKVNGQAGMDDFGLWNRMYLVVSEKALTFLRDNHVAHAEAQELLEAWMNIFNHKKNFWM